MINLKAASFYVILNMLVTASMLSLFKLTCKNENKPCNTDNQLSMQCENQINHLKNKHNDQLMACRKTEKELRENLTKNSKTEISEIRNDVKEIIKIGKKQTDAIEKINGKQFDKFRGKKIVHLDLKGAPPKIEPLLKMIRQIKEMGGTGLLIEYEDMFPWKNNLKPIAKNIHYSEDDIRLIEKTANDCNLEIIPNIQSLSYVDFVLKIPKYAHLREHKESTHILDPSKPDSLLLIKEMINQILKLHPKSKWIHLGSTQVKYLKKRHIRKITERSSEEMFKSFMISLFKYVSGTFLSESGETVQAIMWDDMIRKWPVEDLKQFSHYNMTPMVWSYRQQVEEYYPKDMWDRYEEAFNMIWVAGSFKGTHRPWSNRVRINDHIENTLSWLQVLQNLKKKNIKIAGIALMGWSRYDHYAPLCELFPVAIPSLQTCLSILKEGQFNNDMHKSISALLKFKNPMRLHPEFMRKYKVETPGYKGGDIYELVQQLEKATGYDEWVDMREKGWTRMYYIKQNQLNYLYLNETLTDVRKGQRTVIELLQTARSKLSEYYFNESVEEWISDKLILEKDIFAKKVNLLDWVFQNATFP